jgi:hypothetical protein
MLLQSYFGQNVVANQTATADTVINAIAPASPNGYTQVSRYRYSPGSADHVVTGMRPIGKTYIAADAAASQAVIRLLADPGASISPTNLIAAGDYLVIKNNDGTFVAVKVSSVSGLSITLTANLSKALSAGNEVWFYGVKTDTDPVTGLAHPKWTLATGDVRTLSGDSNGLLIASHEANQPILMQSDNVTDAGTLLEMVYRRVKS